MAIKNWDNKRLTTLAVHAIFIGIIFILPEALLRVAVPGRTLDISWPMYAKGGITIGVFYLNYFLVIPHTIIGANRGKRWQFLAWNILIVIAGAVLIWIIYHFLYSGPRPPLRQAADTSPLAAISYIFRDSIMLILAISLAVALRVSSRWLDLEQRHQKLTAIRKQTELDSLRSQLNPHFLFNVLNAIYVLIAVNPDEAQKAVHDLSSLLRYFAYENPRTVLLDQELNFAHDFFELMRLRTGSRPVTLDIERHDDENVQIPPMILLGLMGNAFKHGNTPDQTLPISIHIQSDRNRLVCRTDNHFIEKSDAKPGVGLANLRRRLELIYGPKASLQTEANGDVYTAVLCINHTPE